MDNYKASKEAFVSGMTGSTMTHVNLISAAALCSIALHASIRTQLAPSTATSFLLEWTVLVLPLLLSMTLFAERPILHNLFLIIPIILLRMLPAKDNDDPPLSPISISRAPSLSSFNSSNTSSGCTKISANNSRIVVSELPSLTVYRSHMMLMTCLAILAVDFPVFPRSLAKCETFGVSLMDLGVGSFVFAQGVVSAIPLLKDPGFLLVPALPKTRMVFRKVLPLFFLGVVRVISVKGTEYPEHESEYGTHWNFFFTMAFLPVLQVMLHPVIIYLPISLLGFSVALFHQLALSLTSLKDFTLNAPRTNLISANKEGLVSLSGYLAIHLLGLSVGTVLLPPSPSDFRRQQHSLRLRLRDITSPPSPSSDRTHEIKDEDRESKMPKRQDGKTVIELFSYAILWWSCLGVCYLMTIGGGVSRRLANMPYVIWVAAYNTSFIMFYLLLDKLSPSSRIPTFISPSGLHPPSSSRHSYSAQNAGSSSKREAPALLAALNKNGLAIFLLANVMTGLINLSMSTMYASDTVAIAVLGLYSFMLSLVAWMCRRRRLWKM